MLGLSTGTRRVYRVQVLLESRRNIPVCLSSRPCGRGLRIQGGGNQASAWAIGDAHRRRRRRPRQKGLHTSTGLITGDDDFRQKATRHKCPRTRPIGRRPPASHQRPRGAAATATKCASPNRRTASASALFRGLAGTPAPRWPSRPGEPPPRSTSNVHRGESRAQLDKKLVQVIVNASFMRMSSPGGTRRGRR